MDAKALIRLENSIHQIKELLLSDSKIRKLLYYSSSEVKKSLDDMKDVSVSAVADNIYMQLVLDIDTQPPFNKQNFIALRINAGAIDEQKINYIVDVTICSEKHDWIVGGKIRPLLLAQAVIDRIDGEKFELSNPFTFHRFTEQVLNGRVTGYTLTFTISDGIRDL